eukprot:5554429-Prymnesium_polylepis.2
MEYGICDVNQARELRCDASFASCLSCPSCLNFTSALVNQAMAIDWDAFTAACCALPAAGAAYPPNSLICGDGSLFAPLIIVDDTTP